MRYLLRLSLVFIIMTLSCSTASADKYSRAWKKVNAYLEKDLPESAAKEINNIWDMAAQDGDGRQMLKSAVYLTSVQQTFQENSITDGIELFKTLLPKLTVQEHQALCHAFLVEGYKCFRDNNLNLLRHNREIDDPDAPINMWTIKMITDTICYHLNQSINLAGDVAAHAEEAQDAEVELRVRGIGERLLFRLEVPRTWGFLGARRFLRPVMDDPSSLVRERCQKDRRVVLVLTSAEEATCT